MVVNILIIYQKPCKVSDSEGESVVRPKNMEGIKLNHLAGVPGT